MRLCWVAGVILLAGIGAWATDDITSVEASNNRFTLGIQTDGVTRCYLVSPAGETIDLIPDDKPGGRFEVNASSGCSVTVSEAERNDSGLWMMHADTESGYTMSQRYQVTVPREGEIDGIKIDDDDETINWLPEIRHVTRVGLEVTITLSKTSHEEECFIRTPEPETFKLEEFRRTGVAYHYGSEFVSCRVVIGPMEEDGILLEDWALCGRYTEDSVQHMRCQPVNIRWNDANNPNREWQTTLHPQFEYAVNYGKTLTPALSEPRDIITCHIITPYGEDLVVTEESDYPDLARVRSSTSVCSIAIGPIHAGLIGDWTIYAVYSSIFGTVEQRRPMHLYLYDNDNPYNQAYNITNLDPIDRIVNLHSTIEMRVTDSSDTNDCYSKDPSGLVYTTENTTSSAKVSFITENGVCRIIIGPITEDMLGDWQLTGKFRNSRFNTFIERRLPVRLIKEDPANPAEDIPRRIENVTPLRFDTKFNASHTISIRGGSTSFVTYESCHLITPYKLQYIIMEGFNVPGVEVIEDRDLACGVIIHVDADENIGEWTLMSREIVLGTATEKRLPVTIYVEVDVPALPSHVSIGRGNDFYVRLENPTDIPDTCKLVPPSGVDDAVYEIDGRVPEHCGYIVRDFKTAHGGEWRIVYGHGATYIAKTQVTVIANFEATEIDQQWIRDRPVNVPIGPEDTVYCRVQDPSGFAVFEAFGRCNIALDRVRQEHAGTWRMTVMRSGNILTNEQTFTVRVNDPEPRPVVTTSVETGPLDPPNHPYIMLSCSVPTEDPVRNCKFRDPHGRLFLAVEGVGQQDYQFHGIGITINTNVGDHGCGLKITNPTNYDLGIWRCAMETERVTHYGFMLVLCPHAMAVPGVAETVVTEPLLEATTQSVSIVEGETATLSCSVQAPIKYCYFRARNGTVYSASPDSTPLEQEGATMRSYHQNPPPIPSPGRPMPFMEYVGAGFDAGDCGIRIPTLRFADTGYWTCHVGFVESTEPEQSASMAINVEEQMAATQVLTGNHLEVQATVHGARQLEYCRFVRMDGLGFTSDNAPERYISSSLLSQGICRITMLNPTILEIHPWTVVARVHGQDFEIARQTPATFPESNPTTQPPETWPPVVIITSPSFTWLWVLIAMLLLSIFLFGIMLGPRRNRQWTTSRARSFRNSFRGSQKQPLEDNNVNTHVHPNVNTHHVNTL